MRKNNEIQISDNSTSSLLTQNKESIINAVNKVIKLVKDGGYDSLKALIFAHKLKEMGKQLEEGVRDTATKETKLSKGEVYKLFDVEVSPKKVSISYDFTVCNDCVWTRLKIQADIAKKNLEKRETFLKAISQKMSVNDEETGDVYDLYPPNKLESDGLALKLK